MPDLIPVDHDPFADATGFFPAFDAAGTRIPMDVDPASGAPILSNVSQAPLAMQKLFGAPGVERYQTWPEKMIRSAVTLPADAYAGKVPVETRAGFPGAEPEGSRDVLMEPNLLGKALGMSAKWNIPNPEGEIGRAQDLSGLAVTGPLAAAKGSATLGSGMTRNLPDRYLIPALKVDGKIYKGKPGQLHEDIIAEHNLTRFDDEYSLMAQNSGYMNHKGHFLNREKAGNYAADHGLVDDKYADDARNGLTADMLLSDTGKPGSAVSALAHSQQAPVFYSAVEHAINNVRNDKMSPDQWVGYLKNQSGVKAEELAWMGLDDPKSFGAGKKQLTKQEVLDHAKEHGVEIKEVNKSGVNEDGPPSEWIADTVREHAGTVEDQFKEQHGREPNANEHARLMRDLEEEIYSSPRDFGWDTTPEHTAAKFSEYQLPGGENYREMLFTLPKKDAPKADVLSAARKMAESQGDDWAALGPNGRQRYEDAARYDLKGKDGNYQSSHWDEPNVLAHVRMNDRDLPGVGKTLHLEELQSDWHQQGRKQGYRQELKTERPEIKSVTNTGQTWEGVGNYQGMPIWRVETTRGDAPRDITAATEQAARESWQRNLDNGRYAPEQSNVRTGVPDAPFKTTWPDLVLKRMIREASEKGYDAISWTPGEAQAARYDLSKQVENISVKPPTGSSDRHVTVNARSGVHASALVNDKGVVTKGYDAFRDATGKHLSDLIGKEMTERILKSEKETKFEGEGLKVGGEGMKAFYDKMLVDKANAIAKKFGGKVEKQKIPTNETNKDPLITDDLHDRAVEHLQQVFEQRTADQNWSRATRERKYEEFAESPEGERIFNDIIFKGKPVDMEIHVLRLPQTLRDTATRKGFPLFAAGLPFSFEPVDHDPFQETK